MSSNPNQAKCTRCFFPGTPVSSTNKTDCHDITEILLKMALNTILYSHLEPFSRFYQNLTGICYTRSGTWPPESILILICQIFKKKKKRKKKGLHVNHLAYSNTIKFQFIQGSLYYQYLKLKS